MGNITTPFKARPTIYKGIEMRSRLEALWAAEFDGWADDQGLSWEYEPFCFASGKGQYLPDFRLYDLGQADEYLYVEVKPFMDDPVPTMERMETILDSELSPDTHVTLWLVAGKPTEDYRHWACKRTHPLSWYEWCDVTDPTFQRIIPTPQWFSDWRESEWKSWIMKANETGV